MVVFVRLWSRNWDSAALQLETALQGSRTALQEAQTASTATTELLARRAGTGESVSMRTLRRLSTFNDGEDARRRVWSVVFRSWPRQRWRTECRRTTRSRQPRWSCTIFLLHLTSGPALEWSQAETENDSAHGTAGGKVEPRNEQVFDFSGDLLGKVDGARASRPDFREREWRR